MFEYAILNPGLGRVALLARPAPVRRALFFEMGGKGYRNWRARGSIRSRVTQEVFPTLNCPAKRGAPLPPRAVSSVVEIQTHLNSVFAHSSARIIPQTQANSR